MPAQSKSQRRLFALALLYKRGELNVSDTSEEVKELSKLPEKTLEDFASTSEKGLPENLELGDVPPMGNVELPGNPSNLDSFTSQEPGSGDIPFQLSDNKEKEKKKKWLLSFMEYINK